MRPKKESSPALERAVARAAAISSIDPALDMDNGLDMAGYKAAVEDTRQKLDAYNHLLSQTDEARTRLAAAETALNDWSRRMLSGVLARYGADSVEYQKAGGTRKSERRRPSSTTKKIATSGSALAA